MLIIRLFVNKQCEVVDEHIGTNSRYHSEVAKLTKETENLYEELERLGTQDEGVCSLFGVASYSLINIKIDNNHYIGYPYDSRLYKITNLSLVAETHFEHNQEFHPTEKIYRAIANKHGSIVASIRPF